MILIQNCARGLLMLSYGLSLILIGFQPLKGIAASNEISESKWPTAEVGTSAAYTSEEPLPASVIKNFTLTWGPTAQSNSGKAQWLRLEATKGNNVNFRAWLLTQGYPSENLRSAQRQIERYIIQVGDAAPIEFRDQVTEAPVLPSSGGWRYLLPRPRDPQPGATLSGEFPSRAEFLGHTYRLQNRSSNAWASLPVEPTPLKLRSDMLVGVPSNSRTEQDLRRYDGSDYPRRRLTRTDYQEMAAAGMNCFNVDGEQRQWVEDLGVFYWGVGGKDVPYPECLYDSRYIGPALFLDEPAVHARDSVIRPELGKNQTFRRTIGPEKAFDIFCKVFDEAWREGAPVVLLKAMAARPDVNLGTMQFRQQNLFSWETMISTAAYQLSQDPGVPSAIVFEPPGRVGTRRTLPELDMSYGCQIPVDNPQYFADIINGFLRGAARLTGKQWGISIYGAFDRADAPWFLTHAYDLGATRFFFWDNAAMACVPYQECLGLARQLKMRAENTPARDLEQLRNAGEMAILLPPGYNLGHVQLGRGSLWGVNELNLERKNSSGIRYRQVMGNFFTEIERCLRMGVRFDLLWDLPGIQPAGYRETVRIAEDGRVIVTENGKKTVLRHARIPNRPAGQPPILEVSLTTSPGPTSRHIKVVAHVTQTSAPIYYTHGTDPQGFYRNALINCELFGPEDSDYRSLAPPEFRPNVVTQGKTSEATIEFGITRPGQYRLRVAAVDIAGRSTVKWIPIAVEH